MSSDVSLIVKKETLQPSCVALMLCCGFTSAIDIQGQNTPKMWLKVHWTSCKLLYISELSQNTLYSLIYNCIVVVDAFFKCRDDTNRVIPLATFDMPHYSRKEKAWLHWSSCSSSAIQLVAVSCGLLLFPNLSFVIVPSSFEDVDCFFLHLCLWIVPSYSKSLVIVLSLLLVY